MASDVPASIEVEAAVSAASVARRRWCPWWRTAKPAGGTLRQKVPLTQSKINDAGVYATGSGY